MTCPKCGSPNVSIQIVTQTSLKTKHHGMIYWLCIGWWWRPLLWLFLTIPMLFLAVFRPKKYKTKNISRKRAVCQNCGKSWAA